MSDLLREAGVKLTMPDPMTSGASSASSVCHGHLSNANPRQRTMHDRDTSLTSASTTVELDGINVMALCKRSPAMVASYTVDTHTVR